MNASSSAHRARRKGRSAGLKETGAKNRQIKSAGWTRRMAAMNLNCAINEKKRLTWRGGVAVPSTRDVAEEKAVALDQPMPS
jgi:hypothetical protein